MNSKLFLPINAPKIFIKEVRKGGINWETGIGIYTLLCIKLPTYNHKGFD